MAKAAGKKERKGSKRKEKRNVPHGVAHIQATFNNTIISIADPEGNVISWSSAGKVGFKGSRKGTPFAAQMAAQNAGNGARDAGVRSLDVQMQRLLTGVPVASGSRRSRRTTKWHDTQDPSAGCAGGRR